TLTLLLIEGSEPNSSAQHVSGRSGAAVPGQHRNGQRDDQEESRSTAPTGLAAPSQAAATKLTRLPDAAYAIIAQRKLFSPIPKTSRIKPADGPDAGISGKGVIPAGILPPLFARLMARPDPVAEH